MHYGNRAWARVTVQNVRFRGWGSNDKVSDWGLLDGSLRVILDMVFFHMKVNAKGSRS